MNSALLNMPSGIVSIASTLIVGFGVRHTSHRWAWLVACCCVGILGGGLMSFAPASNRAALLVGIYLVNAIVATLTIIYQWTIANCAGQTKRVVASALIAGSFSVGNIIGPQTFQAKDAPQYQPAKITVMATQAGGAVVAVALFLYYVWANKKRDKADAMVVIGEATTSEEELHRWEGQTDKENKSFRYVY
jgi:4-amino-4-deoxy-L-arabinose transferase-like glycosyltransferase